MLDLDYLLALRVSCFLPKVTVIIKEIDKTEQ